MQLVQVNFATGFSDLSFKFLSLDTKDTAIYRAFDNALNMTVFLHVHPEGGFTLYMADLYEGQINQPPYYGDGNTPEAAYAEAIKDLMGIAHGYVTRPIEEDPSLPF